MSVTVARTQEDILDTLQLWSPDTCDCSVHQAVEELDSDVTYPEGYQKYIYYMTQAESVDLHAERFIRRPRNTVRWPLFILFDHLSIAVRKRLRPLFRTMAWSLQARAKECQYHRKLGESQVLYDTVYEENVRKNICQHLAWRIANGISDEDEAWLNSVPNKRIYEARLDILNRVIPELDIEWGFERDGSMDADGYVDWKYPAPLHLHFPEYADVPWRTVDDVQMACDERFPPGMVVVT